MKIENTVNINLPIEVVFQYTSNLENLANWSGFVISAHKISSGETLVGTTIECTILILGRRFDTTYEIVEYRPNRYFSYKSIMGVASSFTFIRFEPLEGGSTKIFVELIVHFTGSYLGYDETQVTDVISHQIASDLRTLKDLLEITASTSKTDRSS